MELHKRSFKAIGVIFTMLALAFIVAAFAAPAAAHAEVTYDNEERTMGHLSGAVDSSELWPDCAYSLAGDTTLTISDDASAKQIGTTIDQANLTIVGNGGTLTVGEGGIGAQDIVIDTAKVVSEGGGTAIGANKTLTIKGSEVRAIGETNGLYAGYNSVGIDDDVVALVVESSDINASGDYYGIFSNTGIKLVESTVTASGSAYGINAGSGALDQTEGVTRVSMFEGTRSFVAGLQARGLNLQGAIAIVAPEDYVLQNSRVYESDGTTVAKTVVIDEARNPITKVDIGNIWTDLSPLIAIPFTTEVRDEPIAEGSDVKFTDQMAIDREAWFNVEDMDNDSITSASPAPGVVGTTYGYKVTLKAQRGYVFAEPFEFVCGGTTVVLDKNQYQITDEGKTLLLLDFIDQVTVQPVSLKDAEVTLDTTTFTADGAAKQPKVASVKVDHGGQAFSLKEGTDFTVSYENNTKAGTANAVITGKGNFKDTAKAPFTITAADELVIAAIPDQLYTSYAIEPALTVKQGGTTLKQGTDYTVAFKNNVEVGIAAVEVTGIGAYEGASATAAFGIQHLATAKGFTDLALGGWYLNTGGGEFPGLDTFYLDYTLARGFMRGKTDTTFDPDGYLTRAEAAMVLYRLANPDAENGSDPNETGLPDVMGNQWYTRAVNWCFENKVVTGYMDENGAAYAFGPDDLVTRDQLATMIARYCVERGGMEYVGADVSMFSDNAMMGDWAKQGIAFCNANGIMTGMGGSDVFGAGQTANRAQMSKIIAVTDKLLSA